MAQLFNFLLELPQMLMIIELFHLSLNFMDFYLLIMYLSSIALIHIFVFFLSLYCIVIINNLNNILLFSFPLEFSIKMHLDYFKDYNSYFFLLRYHLFYFTIHHFYFIKFTIIFSNHQFIFIVHFMKFLYPN